MSVIFTAEVENSNGKVASLTPRDQEQQTCALSSSVFRKAQGSSHRAFTTDAAFDNSSVSGALPLPPVKPGHGNTPVADQASSSSTPVAKSSLQDKQQARSLRYEPNWLCIAQRSLPPREIPRCHDNAKEWPNLGSRTEELEICYDSSVSNNLKTRVKPRFRNFYANSSCMREDLERVPVEEDSVHGKCKKASVADLGWGASSEPKLVMLNQDFIVTSPVRENLLVSLALTSQRRAEDQVAVDVKAPHQVLIGRFRAFSSFLRFKLCKDALRVKFEQNAGGSSTISESLSVEYFARGFQAQDVVTEMEVEYWSSNWKKVDYICTLYGQRVGVSVTRAMSYPDPNGFSTEIAYRLLHKKLYGLVVARDGVSKRHSFCKCILHVWCETQRTANIMKTMYTGVKKELEISDDVIMVLTVADGLHARPIFYEHVLQ